MKKRYKESVDRPAAFEELGKSLMLIKKAVLQFAEKEEKYSHLEQSEIDKVIKCIEEKERWFEEKSNLVSRMNKCEEPIVLVSQIKFEKDVSVFIKIVCIELIILKWSFFHVEIKSLDKTSWSILNRPKPKVEPPKVEEPAAAAEQAAPGAQQEQKPAPSPQAPGADKKPTDGMDVD